VDQMPLAWRTETLHMQWCVDCHRDPAPHIRPREEVFAMGGGAAALASQGELMKVHQISSETNCSVCHR
jgi:hypothetical protein